MKYPPPFNHLFSNSTNKMSIATNYLKVVMAPDQANVSGEMAPDIGASSNSSFPSTVDFSLSYIVQATPVLPAMPVAFGFTYNDAISFQSGVYLSYPTVSVNSRYHMGIVKGGTFIRQAANAGATNSVLRGLDFRQVITAPTLNGGGITVADQVTPAFNLSYNSDLVLPRIGSGQGFSISPELSLNYSKVREYAGKMTIQSSTVQGSSLQLSGTFSTAVIADTRDICQISNANGITGAYPAAVLSTQSVNRGDVLKNSPVLDGVVDLVGCDYPRHWNAPDVNKTDTLDAEWFNALLTARGPISTTGAGIANDVAPTQFVSAWFTPWDTDCWVAWTDLPNPGSGGSDLAKPTIYQRIKTQPINEDGALDLIFRFKQRAWNDTAASGDNDNIDFQISGSVVHVFGRIQADGLTNYTTVTEGFASITNSLDSNFNYGPYGTTAVAARDNPNGIARQFEFVSRLNRESFDKEGKYVGSYLSGRQAFRVNNAPAPAGNTWIFEVYDMKVTVRARNIDADGRIGPAHVVRYDDVSVGQTIQFQGVSLLQGVALGKLQPFVQKATGSSFIPDDSLNRILDNLFTTSDYFKRIQTLTYYNTVTMPWLRDAKTEDIAAEIGKSGEVSANTTMMSGAAAGLFGGLGSMFGPLGSLAGGALDRLTGTSSGAYGDAAGMFGRDGQAAGMFGPGGAAGMFGPGGAAGMFGRGQSAADFLGGQQRRLRD